MAESEKDRISREVAGLRITFDIALSNKREYPVTEFKAFVQSARRHIEIIAGDPMIHKGVAQEVNGPREFLEVERKLIHGDIFFEADRLECQLFARYDPKVDGDEPPGLGLTCLPSLSEGPHAQVGPDQSPQTSQSIWLLGAS